MKHLFVATADQKDVEGRPIPEVKKWNRKVWAVHTIDAYNRTREVEFFSEQPKTVQFGGHPSNWPPSYDVYEGNLDGGDSVCIEQYRRYRIEAQR